jgi:hypothetical protein
MAISSYSFFGTGPPNYATSQLGASRSDPACRRTSNGTQPLSLDKFSAAAPLSRDHAFSNLRPTSRGHVRTEPDPHAHPPSC